MEENVLKKMVRRHKKAYALGLSGPDIFFYFVPDQLLVRPTPGSRMHEEKCGAFLRCMLREALAMSGEEREIAAAYLAGFIGHYALDVSCHPRVYEYIEEEARLLERGEAGRVSGGRKTRAHKVSGHERTGIHFRYECAMDHYFLQRYAAKTTGCLHQRKMVRLKRKERGVISRLVAAAYNKTYDRPNMSGLSVRAVLSCVWLVQGLIRDPHGRKERVLCPFERLIYRHPFLAGLFVNDNCYGVGQDEWERMHVLFRAGLKEYDAILAALSEVMEGAEKEERTGKSGRVMVEGKAYAQETAAREKQRNAVREFYRRLGSKSYHTGEKV